MRLFTLTLSFLVLVFAAIFSAYWFYAAGLIGTQITSWRNGDGPLGLTLATEATPQIQGFPFSFSVTLGPATVGDPARWGNSKVVIPELVSWSHPWSPRQWRFQATKGGSFKGQDPSLDHLKIATLEGEIKELSSERGTLIALNLAVGQLTGQLNGAAVAAAKLNLHLSAPETQPQLHTGEALAFALVLEQARLPSSIEPLGQTITNIAAVGAVDGSIPRQPLPQALASWRDGGGTVEIHHLTVEWGPLSLSGDGTLALDTELQPIGAFSAKIVNYGAIIDALISSGMIKATDGSYVNIGLGLLAQKDDDGHSVLKAPVTLQNDSLFIGPAKLTSLPRIVWQ